MGYDGITEAYECRTVIDPPDLAVRGKKIFKGK
jgi:hypothetical protein